MKHLHEWSVFEDWNSLPGQGDLSQRTASLGIDGYELFTIKAPVQDCYVMPEVVSVHLPYAIDWRSAWEGRSYEGMPEDVTYFSFGHDREEMVGNLRDCINYAAKVRPAYGVLHAGNTDIRQVLHRRHESDDLKVLGLFADFINQTVSGMPGGEPPFKLALENLWWEGLKLRSPEEWRLLERKLEFDNWGFTLDTGHLMNTCDGAYDEDSAIDEVMAVIDRYPRDMRDRIGTIHLQLSCSAAFRESIESEDRGEDEPWESFYRRAAKRATDIDNHLSFTSGRVREITDAIDPEYVNHELMGHRTGDRYEDLRQQRRLFG
ncbi:hypothetical protein TALC_00525 [Thermoplasmatales archaeon BRNA1]|nr:hypothetical protein TALC_00525 [Thermoplasmatales archaeon BRNA1]